MRYQRAGCREVPHDSTVAEPHQVPELRLGGDHSGVHDPRGVAHLLHHVQRVWVEGLAPRRPGPSPGLRPAARFGPI